MRNLDYDIVHVPPDKGCKYGQKCLDCLYREQEITVPIMLHAQCVDEEGGLKALGNILRRDTVIAYAKQGFHFAILGSMFGVSVRRIEQIIAEEVK